MKLLSSPKFSCIIETSMVEAEQLSKTKGGFLIRGKDATFLLVQGHWIMILPEKETETDETVPRPKRD